jgi:uncharacterized protein (DUF2267 family)
MPNNSQSLDDYYLHVESVGKLLTRHHANRWSDAVLKTLGTVLDGRSKRALAKALPDELSRSLRGVFWLLHFRDPQMRSHEFQQRVARRAGNTDPEFARLPIVAVFEAVSRYVDADLSGRMSRTLPPEVATLWQEANGTRRSA